ncbi:TIGR04104 family putative zinc finger protein [Sediminibacillus albus]|uniref:Cxxc_20_cxxc protein n=1 Tax=Sediminibacillus albus TaxID=407036 RepID=A0A1G8WPM8_9BACI|nr:TIGR04104 family putative zinc finger protein [Sediminibacillus albus]SDJ80053.1 cxxc_20_cxxc protein [Sediminibacillus albus]
MPTCQNCGKEWTWKQTVKSVFKLHCPYCGKKQYETASSRRRGGMVALLPLLVLPANAVMDFGWAFIPALVVIACVIFIIYPFLLKLSNEEEPLW